MVPVFLLVRRCDHGFPQVDAIRTLREMNLLRGVNHDNVIRIKDIMQPLSKDKFQDVYIVYECMDTDLHQIIRSPQPLTDDHFQYFIWQVCVALEIAAVSGISTDCHFWYLETIAQVTTTIVSTLHQESSPNALPLAKYRYANSKNAAEISLFIYEGLFNLA